MIVLHSNNYLTIKIYHNEWNEEIAFVIFSS